MATEKLLSAVQVAKGADLVDILVKLNDHPRLRHVLEDLVIKNVSKLSQLALYRLLHLQVGRKQLNTQLIAVVKKQLASMKLEFKLPQLKNLFYTCASLKINDKNLLNAMAENLDIIVKFETENVKSNLLQILRSCSYLGWVNKVIVDIVRDKLLSSLFNDDITESQRHDIVVYLGKLNLGEDFGDIVKELVVDLSGLKKSAPSQWLDLVSAQVNLRQPDAETITAVLQPDFYRPLLEQYKGRNSSSSLCFHTFLVV